MAAISKSWVTIADTAVDPDSPLDAALLTGLRDDLVHLREWLGASYTGGAVQDHNHDGVNSALVPVGPNALRNGSFEDGTTGWTLANYTGGTVAQNALDFDGNFSLGITSTVLANGGGTATSNEYTSCTESLPITLMLSYRASVANISARAEVLWYDAAKALLSATNLLNVTNAPTAFTTLEEALTPPANARWYRVRLTGGVPAAGSATGTVYFDGVYAGARRGLVMQPAVTLSGATYTFSNIPAWVRHVVLVVRQGNVGNSLNARLGTSGGVVSSGYTQNGIGGQVYLLTGGVSGGGTGDYVIELWRLDGSNDVWIGSLAFGESNTGSCQNMVGTIDLTGVLTQLQLSNGVGSLSGSACIAWE